MALIPPPDFTPDFSRGHGLIAAIAQDAVSREVLMLAWMDAAAWQATLDTGEAHYFSRSRQRLWRKGEKSGHVQRVRAIRLDCDADAVLLEVEQEGGACHEGYQSCFFRRLDERGAAVCSPRVFDPGDVYPS